MRRINKENVFIFISIIFILGLFNLYAARFIYFRFFASNKVKAIPDLVERILKKEVLYKEKDNYYFKGKTNSNYVIYSNQLWQIVSINNKTLTLISQKPITNLFFDEKYSDSIINEYMNDDFYSVLDKSQIIKTYTCINDIKNNTDDCNNKYINNVTLLPLFLYEKVGGTNSFINNGYYNYLSNEGNKHYYIDDKGNIGTNDGSDLYGIKVLITINSKDIISGSGTQNDPYVLDKAKTNLKDANVGSYVTFSNKLWRIIKNTDSVRLISNETLKSIKYKNTFTAKSTLYKYLNEEYIHNLKEDYLVESTFYNGYFINNTKTIFSKITAFVGMPFILDLYLNDVNDYALITYNDTYLYNIKNNGTTSKEVFGTYNIRPVINIKNDLNISGSGTINDPYTIVGEDSE